MFPYTELLSNLHQDLRLSELVAIPRLTKTQFARAALGKSFFKKLLPLGHDPKLDELALKKFLLVNENVKSSFESTGDFASLFSSFREIVLLTVERARGERSMFECLREHINIGPGAARGVNSESFYTKLFDGDLTATDPHLIKLYRACIFDSRSWAAAEYQRSTDFGVRILPGNRLFFVPKNSEISRIACTEPLVNMLFQKAIGTFLETALRKSFGISLSDQPGKNQDMAKRGSVDGSLSTIDLSSASDSISWALCQQILPHELVGWLRLTRSPVTSLPDGSELPLRMVSTMGNGFTFPLETLIFASAVRAVYRKHGFPCNDSSSEFGVFGDDIIVRTEVAQEVIDFLAFLGFAVNASKTFIDGDFRESCGFDAYQGVNVRGVYLYTLETPQDRYSAYNRLTKWCARHNWHLPRTLAQLRESVEFLPVPYSEQDTSGIKVPYGAISQIIKRGGPFRSFKYERLSFKAPRVLVPEDPAMAKSLGFRSFNSEGWATTCLAGHSGTPPRIVGDRYDQSLYVYIRPRSTVSRWYRKKCFIPYWDFLPVFTIQGTPDGLTYSAVDMDLDRREFERWLALVEFMNF